MTIAVVPATSQARDRNEAECCAVPLGDSSCPPWCLSHADSPVEGVSHTRLIASLIAGVSSIQIAVVQHERAGRDLCLETTIYISVHSGREPTRLTLEAADLLVDVLERAGRDRTQSGMSVVLGLPAFSALPRSLSSGNGEWLTPLIQALREAINTILSTRRTPCPPWCCDEHSAPFDTQHGSEIYGVELSHYPYWVNNECYASPLLAALRQDSIDSAPIVALTGPDGGTEVLMTLDEAEDAGKMLLELVASGKSALPPGSCDKPE
ncbi:hypothetical protein [Nonomuraea sp. NPDC003214]